LSHFSPLFMRVKKYTVLARAPQWDKKVTPDLYRIQSHFFKVKNYFCYFPVSKFVNHHIKRCYCE